jgi:predicted Rossmann fold nucleotide-binding protein DprA/Smf involved in DNA uptake
MMIMTFSRFKTLKTLQEMQEPDKIRIGIVGSRTYENKSKIRETIFRLKQLFGAKLEIVSGGAQAGADRYAKKYSLEMGVTYKEFNPAHTVKNLYSIMPESYFEKPYHVSQLFHRNELIIKYVDKVIAFRSEGKSSGTDHAIKMAQKHEKPYVIISEKA